MSALVVSATKPATFRILRAALLARGPFTQTDLARKADASVSQANRVVRWLEGRRHVQRQRDGRYQIKGAVGLVSSVFPYQRTMGDCLVHLGSVRAGRRALTDALVEAGGVLCLESALEEYSEFFRADRVCVYHEEPEVVAQQLEAHEGGSLPVFIYRPDLPLQGDVEENRRTTRFRTVVDLACDGKLYAAKDLLQDLWGVILE